MPGKTCLKRNTRAWWMRSLCAAILIYTGAASAATSEEYLREAENYLKKGETQAAVIQLKNALQQDPDNARARLRLGEIYLRLGQGAAAAKELAQARKLGAKPEDVLVPLGRAYLMQRAYQQVLDEIKAPKAAPATLRAEVLALHGQAELALRRLPDAKEKFTQAQALDADNVAALLGFARLAVFDKDNDAASRYVERALTVAPNELDAWLLKGELARLGGDLLAAKGAFTRAVEIAPNNFVSRTGKAMTHIGLGEHEQASRDIDALSKRFPQHPMTNYLQAVLAYQKKDLPGAEAALRNVQKAAPNHVPSLLLMGAVLYAQGKFEQAQPQLAQYMRAAPNHGPGRKLLAATHLKLNQPQEAITVLENGVEQATDDAQWLALLGSAYLRAGDPSQANEWLEKAVNVAPDLAALRTQLALSHLSQGQTAQAVTELESAVDLGQGLFQSDILLVLAHLRNRDLDQGLQAAQALIQKLPDNPLSHNLLGGVYMAKGDADQARRSFEKALDLAPGYSAAAINLVRLDVRDGKFAQAEGRLQAILEKNDGHIAATLALAELATRQGRPDEALSWVKKAWEKNPGALQPGLMLAEYHVRRREYLQAIGIGRELSKAHPKNPRVLQMLGATRLAMGEAVLAVKNFEEAAKLQTQSPRAYWLLANAQATAKDYDAAIASINQALSLKADYLPAQVALVRLKQRTKKSQEALQLARQIQEQHPQSQQGYLLEGDIHMGERAYADAAQSYAAGYSRQQTAELTVKLYQARARLGDMRSAREPMEAWVADHPEDLRVRRVLAQAYLQAGESEAAIEQYQVVVKAQPKDIVTLNNLAWLLHEQNDPGALAIAQQAHDLAPDNMEIADTLGWLLLDRGDPARGLALIQQAASKMPHLSSIRYHLAVALMKNDREDAARKELERLLRDHKDFPEAEDARVLVLRLQGQPVAKAMQAPPKPKAATQEPVPPMQKETLEAQPAKEQRIPRPEAKQPIRTAARSAAAQSEAATETVVNRRETVRADQGSTVEQKTKVTKRMESLVAKGSSLAQRIEEWAKVWSAQDVEGYFAFYSDQFVPTRGHTMETWRQDRRSKLTTPASVEVTIQDLKVEREDASYAQVSFVQLYRSGSYQDKVKKRLTLIREQGKWKIVREVSWPANT